MEKCTCGNTTFVYCLKIQATNRPNPRPWDAKYIPIIQLRCFACDKFIQTEKQTPELIDTINQHLEDQRFFKTAYKESTFVIVKKRLPKVQKSIFD